MVAAWKVAFSSFSAKVRHLKIAGKTSLCERQFFEEPSAKCLYFRSRRSRFNTVLCSPVMRGGIFQLHYA